MSETLKTKCEICDSFRDPKKGSTIEIIGGIIWICPSCHEDVFKGGLRYNVDIMTVPVSEESFRSTVESNFYVCPSRRLRRLPKFIAFYRTCGASAVTHIARVVDVTFQVSKEKINCFTRIKTNVSWASEDRFDLFEIAALKQLRFGLARESSPPVQNRAYTDFKKFSKARKLRDIYGRLK